MSFKEKMGNYLSSMFHRFLFGACVGAMGLLILFTIGNVFIPLGIIGVLLFLGGFYTAISVLESTKTYIVSGISVFMPDGSKIPCTMIKQNTYAFMPIIPFFCPLFYIPYKTQYFLIKGINAPNISPKKKINDSTLIHGLFNMELLTHAKASALQKNPQIFVGEVQEEYSKLRGRFLENAAPFFEAKLMEEVFFNERLSVCKLMEKNYFLFFYTSKIIVPQGILIAENSIQNIIADPSCLLGATSLNYLTLDHVTLERLSRSNQTVDFKTHEKTIERANHKKQLLTKEILEQSLQKEQASTKKIFGWILCFCGVGALELTIAGFVTGALMVGIISLPITILLFYFGVKKIKRSKLNKAAVLNGQYKVLKVLCTNVVENEYETDSGFSCTYTVEFANGHAHTWNDKVAIAGDAFYLIYLNGTKEPVAYYSAVVYHPADDIVVEEI